MAEAYQAHSLGARNYLSTTASNPTGANSVQSTAVTEHSQYFKLEDDQNLATECLDDPDLWGVLDEWDRRDEGECSIFEPEENSRSSPLT